MASENNRQHNLAKTGAWILAGLAALTTVTTTVRQLIWANTEVLYGSDGVLNWLLGTLPALSDWEQLATVLVSASLAFWLRDTRQRPARGLFTATAAIGLFHMTGSALMDLAPGYASIETVSGVLRLVWMGHFAALIAGTAAMGAALAEKAATKLYGVAGSTLTCNAAAFLVGHFADSDGSFIVVSVLIVIGWVLVTALSVMVAREASRAAEPQTTREHTSGLRAALFVLVVGLTTRVLFNIVLSIDAIFGSRASLYSRSSDMLWESSFGGLAGPVAATLPLLGVWLLWRAERGKPDAGPARFRYTFVLWLGALVVNLGMSAYAAYTTATDGYVSKSEMFTTALLANGVSSLLGLVGMMTLFLGLSTVAGRYDTTRWQNFSIYAHKVPTLLGIQVGGIVAGVLLLRLLTGGYGGPPTGLVITIVGFIACFALYVGWQIFSVLLGMTHALIVHEAPPETSDPDINPHNVASPEDTW